MARVRENDDIQKAQGNREHQTSEHEIQPHDNSLICWSCSSCRSRLQSFLLRLFFSSGDDVTAILLAGGAERGDPMSQSAYRRVCGAATSKGAAQRGCSATGP